MKIENKQYLTFDDVELLPQISSVKTRDDVSLVTHFSRNIILRHPFVASPMDTVSTVQMVCDMGLYGGIGILHRFWQNQDDHNKAIKQVFTSTKKRLDYPIGFAVSINNYKHIVSEIYNNYTSGRKIAILLDVAHGGMVEAIRITEELLKYSVLDGEKTFDVIAPSISTIPLAKTYINMGVDAIRVGIGNGAVCKTRVITGHGTPQLTAIADVCSCDENYNTPVIADGGIRSSGDVVKAIGAGANSIMLGRILAYTEESGGWEKQKDGTWSKEYYGMASSKFSKRVPEGEIVTLTLTDKPNNIVKTLKPFIEGVQSGLSYSGAHTIEEFWGLAKFIKVTHNGYLEGLPKINKENNVISK